MNTKFKTREEYKQFVKDWKTNYSDLSVAIRKIKKSSRKLQSMGAIKKLMCHLVGKTDVGHYVFDNPFIQLQYDGLIAQREIGYGTSARVAGELDITLRGISEKKLATKMLEVRATSKVEAQAQYLANKSSEEVTIVTSEDNNLTTSTS